MHQLSFNENFLLIISIRFLKYFGAIKNVLITFVTSATNFLHC